MKTTQFWVSLLIATILACALGEALAQAPSTIVITQGGTYSGAWISVDPNVPAVSINTTQPVVIENCTIRSKSDLIKVNVSNAHVTIRNCIGIGLDPMVAGRQRGNFFQGYQLGSLVVEHNYMEATNAGIVLYGTDGWSPDGALRVRYNRAKNFDGAPSDGKGGRILTDAPFGTDWGNHFVNFASHHNMQDAEIAWNEVQCDPTLCWMGDKITIYAASGTQSTPIQIHNNYLWGGYPAIPTDTIYYSGGITMDGRTSDTAATTTAYVKIHDNQVVAHGSFGIGLLTGHDTEAYANRVVSTGQFPDGSWYQGYVGIWAVNNYKQPPSVFFNNFAHDNIVGYRFEYAYPTSPKVFSPPVIRQDYIFTDCAGGASGPASKCINNISLPDPITSATEANEAMLWQQKRLANNITLGPAVTQTVTFAPASPVASGAAPITLTATASSGLTTFTFSTSSAASICTVSGNQLTIVGVGTCALTATQAGNASYMSASASANVVINQPALPDLVVTAMSADSSAQSGAPVAGSATVVNQGMASAGVNRLQFYASTNNVITTSSINTGFGCNVPLLAPGASFVCGPGTISVLSLTPGAYYFGAIADVDAIVAESNKTNNALAASAPTQITGSPSVTNGVCGAANGSTTPTIPTNLLCNVGIPTAVTGTGPWYWTCTGSSGGTTASCSAKQGPAAPANSFPLIPLIVLLL